MRATYFLPRGETAARRSKTGVTQHFGPEAIRTSKIRHGGRWNKVEVWATVAAHEDARSLAYLGLLDVRTGSPYP